ncbi:TPA: restriction endonuclease subunit S [Streptococcus suis]|nr:restriction endonuclease subunit S [Streptococcus suis]
MSEVISLRSITSKIGSGATPKGGNTVYENSGIAFIRSQNVLDMSFSTQNLAYITNEQANKLNNVIVENNDILLNITGDSIARCTIVPDELLPARVNQHVSIIRCISPDYANYVCYYLQFLKPYLLQICKVGGTRNALTKEAVENLPIVIQKEYKIIGKLLSTIDQKIALNNQINEELEAMAKALYDYWFMQFDFPDENGKPYKSSGGKMVYNDQLKREIPEGWGVKPLGELADLYQPQTLSEKDLISNGRYFVYGANGIIGKYNKYNHETPMLAIACRGNSCGVINITQPFSWITGNAMVVKPKFEYICIDYLKYSLLNGNIYKTISGSAQPQITRTNLSPLLLLQADETILSEYADRINSMFSFRIKNFQQNQELTQLRDWLLPMLMNGQVKVE